MKEGEKMDFTEQFEKNVGGLHLHQIQTILNFVQTGDNAHTLGIAISVEPSDLTSILKDEIDVR